MWEKRGRVAYCVVRAGNEKGSTARRQHCLTYTHPYAHTSTRRSQSSWNGGSADAVEKWKGVKVGEAWPCCVLRGAYCVVRRRHKRPNGLHPHTLIHPHPHTAKPILLEWFPTLKGSSGLIVGYQKFQSSWNGGGADAVEKCEGIKV